jgi:hypothetical protein
MKVIDKYILDEEGRILLLRGCNLGGDSKYPSDPLGASYVKGSLERTEDVSFINRPFPLEEADEHFSRMADWGFTLLRFIITWEAVEHAGPGLYDESYLAWLRKLLKKAEEYGLSVYMDPHQDVWSRWTGGDGAPAWTMERLGMDLSKMDVCAAAFTNQRQPSVMPVMTWPSNYSRYAAATMFTLFYAGETYAPDTLVDGVNVQHWLQDHYIAAMRHAWRRLKDCKAIIGWGVMNEPHPGFIAYTDLQNLEQTVLEKGPLASGFQSMLLASGHSCRVPVYAPGLKKPLVKGHAQLNPDCLSLFKEGFECPWKKNGVWEDGPQGPELLHPDWFSLYQGRPVNFVEDFWRPFARRFANTMSDAKKKCLIFLEGVPHAGMAAWSDDDAEQCVHAFHWYDGMPLILKRYLPFFSVRSDTRQPVFGRKAVKRSYYDQFKKNLEWTRTRMANMPCLLGEFGVPMDIGRDKLSVPRAWDTQIQALSDYYDAADSLMLHACIWNYSATNTRAHGDGWNGEDLSIWNSEEGPRAMRAWRRPYPVATAGMPLRFSWDHHEQRFEFDYEANPEVAAETRIYVPEYCFDGPFVVELLRLDTNSATAASDILPAFTIEGNCLLIEPVDQAQGLRLVVRRANAE